MKFYKSKNLYKIGKFPLTVIYDNSYYVEFYKNGKSNNCKNAAFFCIDGYYKDFYLNGKFYGNQYTFTKQSWRRFCKLKAFL